MAYQIDRFNRTPLVTVQDGTLDETTDIKFVGKNYAGYGEIQNENMLFLLENFSGSSQPPKPVSGQIWHDSTNGKIKLIHAKGNLQCNHGDAILRSAINGGGLAMLSRFVVGRHIAAGTLVSILDEYVQEDVPIYAVYPSGKHLSLKVRAFLDFLIEVYGPVPYWDEEGDHNSDAAKRTVI